MYTGVIGQIQFVSQRRDLSNDKVRSLPTKHLVLVRSSLQSIDRAETKPDLVVNVEFLPTVLKVVISLNERIDFVHSYLRVLSQMLSHKSPLQHILQRLQSIGQTVDRSLNLISE